MPLHVLIAFIGTSGGLFMLLGWLLLRITLTRRLKGELKPRGEYWESGTLDFGFLNTGLFAWAIVLPWVQRSVKFRLIYPYLNVKARANGVEVAFAYGMIGGLFVLLLSCIVFVFVEP